jgi:hypothetical protein
MKACKRLGRGFCRYRAPDGGMTFYEAGADALRGSPKQLKMLRDANGSTGIVRRFALGSERRRSMPASSKEAASEPWTCRHRDGLVSDFFQHGETILTVIDVWIVIVAEEDVVV